MRAFRTVGGIVAGYVMFGSASMLLVSVVMLQAGPWVVPLGLAALAVIGALAGWVATTVAGTRPRLIGHILAGLVGAATLANLLLRLGAEPGWYKVGTLFLTVPLILLVSRARDRPADAGTGP